MSREREVFKSISDERRGSRVKASRRLLEPTQQVVNSAISLVKQGEMDELGRKKVIVKDPETGQFFSVHDINAKARLERPYSDLIQTLSGGLFIYPLYYDAEDQQQTEHGIQVPGLPELVNIKNIYLLRGIHSRAMKKVARQLKRAEVVK